MATEHEVRRKNSAAELLKAVEGAAGKTTAATRPEVVTFKKEGKKWVKRNIHSFTSHFLAFRVNLLGTLQAPDPLWKHSKPGQFPNPRELKTLVTSYSSVIKVAIMCILNDYTSLELVQTVLLLGF